MITADKARKETEHAIKNGKRHAYQKLEAAFQQMERQILLACGGGSHGLILRVPNVDFLSLTETHDYIIKYFSDLGFEVDFQNKSFTFKLSWR